MARASTTKVIEITPPNWQSISLRAVGASPLMMHRFSTKMRHQMEEAQTAKDKTKKKREPKDYKQEYMDARYISTAKWDGLPAAMFRHSMIAACRTITGLAMTQAKGAFVVKAQGREREDGTSLVRIHGKPQHDTRPVRLESGVADLRNRPRYDDWYCDVTIEYDADRLSANDIANLFSRAGLMVGIGELRPQGARSFGGDMGMWTVETATKRRRKVA